MVSAFREPTGWLRWVCERPQDKPGCVHVPRERLDLRGSSEGSGCGRQVRSSFSHEGWGGFQEPKIGEGGGIPGRATISAAIFGKSGAGSGNGVIPLTG